MDIIKILTADKGKDIPTELDEFNWGAFLLTFIWGIRFRVWITLLAIPLILFQMPLKLNWLLYIILQFYCGFYGNKLAYQTQYNKTAKEFRKQQEKWSITAITLYILLPVIFMNMFVTFVKKSPDNLEDFINNTQCKIAYKNLNKGLSNTYSANTSEELAQNFAKNFKNAHSEGQNVIFSSKKSKLKNYVLSFNIYPELDKCSFEQKNCTISVVYLTPIEASVPVRCTFYTDKYKNITPDKKTFENLKKGYNIFKYL